ncbi:MAG: helix-turn-helix transcriptional regulator [Polyangiaceae bacterium]
MIRSICSPHELDVLRMVAEGKTATEIGKELGISPRTVENHRAHCVEKLGLGSSSELVRYFLRRRDMPPTTA